MKKIICLLMAAALLAGLPATALAGSAPDYSDLVTTAFTYTYGDGWSTYSFSVPQINWPGEGIQAVNDAIWSEMYETKLYGKDGAISYIEQGYSPMPYSMTYEWAVSGDVLSLLISCEYNGDYRIPTIYNVSLSANRRITDSELLQVLGLDQDDFYGYVRPVLADAFEQQCAVFPDDGSKAEQRRANNAEENVRAFRPFLGRSGELCASGKVFTLAGAGEYYQQLTVLGRGQLPRTISSADLPDELPIDERLVYFIEHSDSQYLTEADIAGFDAKLCEYARNGVYARAGRGFQSAELRQFFSQFAWYSPTIEPAAFTDAMLNDYQIRNIALVLGYEQAHGYM